MSKPQSIVTIGIDPVLLDFNAPDFAAMPGLNAEKILAGIQAENARFASEGYQVETVLIDLGETAEATIRAALAAKACDCVVIGAGIRVPPSHLELFEKVLNAVHQSAPQAKIAFNTNPSNSIEAVRRWI